MFLQGLAGRVGLSIGMLVNLVGAVVLLLWIPLRQKPGIGTIANVLVIGTAMDVAPASELPRVARAKGVAVIEIKRTPSRLSRSLDTLLVPGEADAVLPTLVGALRGR